MSPATERILARGHNPTGDIDFIIVARNNNPFSGDHWKLVLANNPWGVMPKLNPEEYEEVFDKLAANASAWVTKRRPYLLQLTSADPPEV